MRWRVFLVLVFCPVIACAALDPPAGAAVDLHVALPTAGVPDQGRDPAVVAIDVAGEGLCAGVLVAADVVLTARRCLDFTRGDLTCPATGPQIPGARDPTTLSVLVGEDAQKPTQTIPGLQIFAPDDDVLCGNDVALLLLESPVSGVEAVAVNAAGAATGDRVRTVSFLSQSRWVRGDVAVGASSARELALLEAPCLGVPGGPAFDETTGEVVGVQSRSAPDCGAGAIDVYTRTEAALPLVQEALAVGHRIAAGGVQAKDSKGPVDLGASCTAGADCAAGICVVNTGGSYCSSTCSPSAPCPAHYKCGVSQAGTTVCVESG